MSQDVRLLDQNAGKSGQALTIGLLILAFILDLWPLVLFVGIAQLLGALALPFAPYPLIYKNVILPAGLTKPNPQPDNPEPHRFALLVGAIFDIGGAVLIASGSATIGWVLVWIVIVLANLNLWLGFCLGCWFYYQLNRFGIPGFSQSPIGEK